MIAVVNFELTLRPSWSDSLRVSFWLEIEISIIEREFDRGDQLNGNRRQIEAVLLQTSAIVSMLSEAVPSDSFLVSWMNQIQRHPEPVSFFFLTTPFPYPFVRWMPPTLKMSRFYDAQNILFFRWSGDLVCFILNGLGNAIEWF